MSLGQLLALLVLIGAFILWLTHAALTPGLMLVGLAALALALLLGGVAFPTFWRSG